MGYPPKVVVKVVDLTHEWSVDIWGTMLGIGGGHVLGPFLP